MPGWGGSLGELAKHVKNKRRMDREDMVNGEPRPVDWPVERVPEGAWNHPETMRLYDDAGIPRPTGPGAGAEARPDGVPDDGWEDPDGSLARAAAEGRYLSTVTERPRGEGRLVPVTCPTCQGTGNVYQPEE